MIKENGGDEDDLIVDIADGAMGDDFVSGPAEELEDAQTPPPKAPTIPDDLDGGFDEEPDSRAAADAEIAPETDDDLHSQLRSERERTFQVQANSILEKAEGYSRYVQSELQKADLSLRQLDMHMEQATFALAAARDAGDSANEIALERKLREIEGLKTQIAQARDRAPTHESIMTEAHQQVNRLVSQRQAASGKQVGANIKAVVPIAERWASQNNWMKTNTQANAFVVSRSNQMVREGWDMNTPGFYAELSRQVGRAFPALKVQQLQASKKPAGRPQMKTPVAPSRAAAASSGQQRSQSANQTRYTLTKSDISAMRNSNLDPNNPTHKKYFAKERLASANRDRS